MQNKHNFLFSFWSPNVGGGVKSVGPKDQVFRKIQAGGSPNANVISNDNWLKEQTVGHR